MSDLDTRVFLLELKVESNKTSEVMYAMKIAELEEKVESLTRTLDMWQKIMGIEVVVSVTGEAGDV